MKQNNKGKTLSKQEIKILGLSSLGGMLEFYDFIIFVFFTHIVSNLFFPSTLSSFWADINTYGVFAASYFARPLGGIIMAHFGDKSGRKRMFMLSILLMVIPTFALGLMPTFESIGYAAPIALLFIRILQGVAIGGELPGAWVFVCEHGAKKSLGFRLGIFTSAVVSGILLGSVVTLIVNLIFTQQEIVEYAWRIPFIIGGIFGIISLYLRKFLHETPVFKEIATLKQTANIPIKEVFKSSKFGIIKSFLTTWVLTGCIVIVLLFMPNLLSEVFVLEQVQKVTYQILAIFFLALGNVFAGFLSDRFGIRFSSFVCSAALVILAYFFYQGVTHKLDLNNVIAIYYCMSFFAGITVFTPIIMVQSFKAPIRYSGISFAYNVSYAIFGGLTPIFFSWAKNDNIMLIGYYMMFLGVLSIVVGFIHGGSKQDS